jgi:hypothetical protein
MIHSMLISKVNNMKYFLFWAIMRSFKKNVMFGSLSNFHNFQKKKKLMLFRFLDTTLSPVSDIFQFHVSIVYNLVLHFISYLLLLHDYLTSKIP